eukprot:4321404-Pyramimonas_sp.AAC.1
MCPSYYFAFALRVVPVPTTAKLCTHPGDPSGKHVRKQQSTLRRRSAACPLVEDETVVVSKTIAEGHIFMIQGKGFGVLRPNTVMMGFPSPDKLASMSDGAKEDYVRTWKAAAAANKTLLLCKGTRDFPDSSQRIEGNVDVWWVFDILPARGMLLIIPYLLMQHKGQYVLGNLGSEPRTVRGGRAACCGCLRALTLGHTWQVWKNCSLRLFVVTGYGENVAQLQTTLEDMLAAAGLTASVHVIQMDAKDAPRYTFAGSRAL